MHDRRSPKRILITGATGYIGRRLAFRLLDYGGYQLRLMVRNRNKVMYQLAEKTEVVEGDTLVQESLAPALKEVDTAYYLIHSMGSKKDYQELDLVCAKNFRDACIEAGVRRIVYLGGLGLRENASKHLLSRMETGEVLSARDNEIETIWLRAGVIIGSGSASFEIIRNLCQKLPLQIAPRWVKTMTQPIGIEDVLSYLQESIELETAGCSLVVDIGTEALSFKQMMTQAAGVMGLKRYLLPVPVLSPRLSSYWLILFTPVPFDLASALVEGLRSETLLQNDNARRYFGGIKPASFERTVEAAIRELEENQVVSRWCDSSATTACDVKDFDSPDGAILRDVRIVPYAGEEQLRVFKSACSLGGANGWARYTLLWRMRGLLDKLLGGYGLNRGRRQGRYLRIGDAIDFWKVVDIKEGKRLLLYAQMKVPGEGWLEFDVQPDQLVQTAHFLPQGLWGRLYWYLLVPFHFLIFRDLAKKIVANSHRDFPH